MAIIDPPDYVAIDPALIYDICDLPRESYQRLLQLIGWMWVTKKSGKDLGVKIEELAERWDISERSVYHGLQSLGEKGYITINYARGRVYIRRGPKITDRPREAANHNMPGEPATQQAARGGDTTDRPREAASTNRVRASSLHEIPGFCASSLHETPNNHVVVDSTLSEQDQQQHQLNNNSAVQSACTAAGLWPDMATELEADDWVTPARILRWYEQLSAMQARGEKIGGRPIGSVQALMMVNLRAHREPPEPVKQSAGLNEWGVCARCSQSPCACDEMED